MSILETEDLSVNKRLWKQIKQPTYCQYYDTNMIKNVKANLLSLSVEENPLQ